LRVESEAVVLERKQGRSGLPLKTISKLLPVNNPWGRRMDQAQ